MYRVRDLEKICWVYGAIYLSPSGRLYESKNGLFGTTKLKLAPIERYVVQKRIDLEDKTGRFLHEGDIIKAIVANDEIRIGLVTFAPEYSSYIMLCFHTNEFYVLGNRISEDIEIIGNVFENKDLLPSENEAEDKVNKDDESLQKQEVQS